MARSIFMLLVFAVVGCASTAPESVESAEAPQYDAVPNAPVTVMGWEEGVFTDNESLNSRLSYLRSMMTLGNWQTVARQLDPAIYAEQFAFMRGDDRSAADAASQVIEETFGLNTVGNTIFPHGLRRAERPFAGLQRVRAVEFSEVEPTDRGPWSVRGTVQLDDRTARTLSFSIQQHDDGQWFVIVPQG